MDVKPIQKLKDSSYIVSKYTNNDKDTINCLYKETIKLWKNSHKGIMQIFLHQIVAVKKKSKSVDKLSEEDYSSYVTKVAMGYEEIAAIKKILSQQTTTIYSFGNANDVETEDTIKTIYSLLEPTYQWNNPFMAVIVYK